MLQVNLIKGELGRKARNLASAYRCAAADPQRAAENKRRYAARHPERCTEARRHWREANPGLDKRVKRDSRLRRTYGITLVEYEAMLRKQDGVCAICKRSQNNSGSDWFDVDYSHTTTKVRELLCNDCNKKLAVLENDPEWLTAAQAYLEKHAA